MDVSHANVTITLIGNNKLLCGITNYGALVKNGMDDTELVIQCEHAGEKGHRCTKEICGSLEAKGTVHHVCNRKYYCKQNKCGRMRFFKFYREGRYH